VSSDRTTKEHFKYFKSKVIKWLEVFGLYDWKVFVEHKEDDEDTLASCMPDLLNRIAVINLNTRWANLEVDKESLNRVAFEEVMHIVLARLESFAEKGVPLDQIREEIHSIIRRFESLLFSLGVSNGTNHNN